MPTLGTAIDLTMGDSPGGSDSLNPVPSDVAGEAFTGSSTRRCVSREAGNGRIEVIDSRGTSGD
jgi:hypothetical protein